MASERVFEVRVPLDEEACALKLTQYLETEGLTVSCAESATCGLVAKLLTDRAGSSAWFWGGVESYANGAKEKLLGVSADIIDDPLLGPVSAECAAAMADGMRALSGTDLALSLTGTAGPTGAEEGKPVGTVYLGFSSSFRKTEVIRLQVKASTRDGMRRAFACACLSLAAVYARGGAIIDIASSWV